MKLTQHIDRNVVLTGMTSFFTDISSEMIYPLLQAFIAAIMTAGTAMLGPVLGIIEGIAESTASLLKVFAGYYSDRTGKRKLPVISGYSLSAISRILLFAGSLGWYFVLASRFFDRIGKGLRSAPRDAIISESTPCEMQGKAFGFQRGMDFAGACIGTLACYFLTLKYLDPVSKTLRDVNAFYILFSISIIPAFIGVIFLFFLREKKPDVHTAPGTKPVPNINVRQYNKNLKIFFLAQFIFTLGNSSNQFLLLRSVDMGITLPNVIIMYFTFNLSSTIFSTPFGILSDKIGRKNILIAGYLLYAIVYTCFGFIPSSSNYLLWIFWPMYGFYYAMTEGVEKAFVTDIAPAESKATALGFFHTIVGIGLLPASIIGGFIFSINPGLTFLAGGGLAGSAVLILWLGVKK